jgi:hypothetical protein
MEYGSRTRDEDCVPCSRYDDCALHIPEGNAEGKLTGWTIFDRLYIFKGVVYIVSDSHSSIPDVQFIYSKGIRIQPGTKAEEERLPTDREIRVITTQEARRLFGTGAQLIDGTTVSIDRL